MKTITFFNNKGGVGKTSLVYHLAWMLQELGHRVVAMDLDPQSNLTSAFLDDDHLEQLWPDGEHPNTILGAVDPLMERLGDIRPIEPRRMAEGLWLVPGDLALSQFEDRVSQAWRDCLTDNPQDARDAFRVMTAFYRVAANAAACADADLVLIDVGPNIGAMNRAALVASDHVVIPLGADLFSIQGLRNLGPTLRAWRAGWSERRARPAMPPDCRAAQGSMNPVGYVLLNPSVRRDRPVIAYRRWAARIPDTYIEAVLDTQPQLQGQHELSMIKHFKSLMPLAQDARKPMFLLTSADGAIGGHAQAVAECYEQFRALAQRILDACGVRHRR